MKKSNFCLPALLSKNDSQENRDDLKRGDKILFRFFLSHPRIILICLAGCLLFLLKMAEEPPWGLNFQQTNDLKNREIPQCLDQEDNFLPLAISSKRETLPAQKPVPLPANGIDAFGLPVQGTFLTGSSAEATKNFLPDLASSLPIHGYWEGKEVIIANRVFHPGDVFLLRTPNQLEKIKVLAIECNDLVLQDQTGTEVRIPWPKVLLEESGLYGEIQINKPLGTGEERTSNR
ncbi:hypothetical protein EM20IM_00240 [Candidatus Methylacidiphilum infernorum]|uniref:Uncharacterized protein n=1 Tax=Candidatus Methylacidiphilum infernorum TaxID=511746 RepID=A0ABX7PV14_9BACT|nr:hypothetical protein [Candidatus Methylacidiphilum infernorum]QSR86840.1 hypothetical protein EM20IM_00240 [Candidatus Methylacidiphilum infernorum]